MGKQIRILFLGLAAVMSAFGENAVLEGYVREGLKNNLALRQKDFSYARAAAALGEARGMFLPSVGIDARYSRAGGGRIFDIPIGDLMNPVYSTLNDILQGMGQPAPFPTNLVNERFPFYREQEHDTKIRVIQPIFQPAIVSNYSIRRRLRGLEEASRDAFARQLVAEIKTAYGNLCKTARITVLLDNTEALLNENLRVTKRLAENGKANTAAIYRAEADLQAFLQQKAEAEKNHAMSKAYFNFLLNRPLDSPIDLLQGDSETVPDIPPLEIGEAEALKNREELKQLDDAVGALTSKIRLAQTAYLPGVAAVFDYGYQGEIYRFKPDDDYWMASVVASWNLFSGFQDKYKVDQARLERREAEAKRMEVENQIRLQVREAHQNLGVALKSFEAAQARIKAARKSYEAVDRRYREGMAPQIEYIDARNTLTQAEVNAAVTEFDCQIRAAEYERATGSFDVKSIDVKSFDVKDARRQ